MRPRRWWLFDQQFGGVLSCPSVRWGGHPGRASEEVLATLVLEVAQSDIYISACACVDFVWPHCLRTLIDMCSLVSDMPLYQLAGSWTGKDKVA